MGGAAAFVLARVDREKETVPQVLAYRTAIFEQYKNTLIILVARK
jgi:hypothetical protein